MSIITHWEIYGIYSKNTLMFMCTTETAAPASRWRSFKVIQLAVFIACFPASTLYPNVQSLRCNFLKMNVTLCIILQRGRRLVMWSGVVHSTFDGALIRKKANSSRYSLVTESSSMLQNTLQKSKCKKENFRTKTVNCDFRSCRGLILWIVPESSLRGNCLIRSSNLGWRQV